jgi:hypothetical protein
MQRMTDGKMLAQRERVRTLNTGLELLHGTELNIGPGGSADRGVPVPADLAACTGAVEIAVHGWDMSAACGGVRSIPAALVTRMLRLGPLLVAGREGWFAVPVEVPAQASPGDRLVGYLGRAPR